MISNKNGLDYCTYNSSLWFDEGPVGAVHLVVEAAGVAQVVPVAIAAPQRRRCCAAVNAFSAIYNRNKKTL